MPALTFLPVVVLWDPPSSMQMLPLRGLRPPGSGPGRGWERGICTRPWWTAEGAPGPAHSPIPSGSLGMGECAGPGVSPGISHCPECPADLVGGRESCPLPSCHAQVEGLEGAAGPTDRDPPNSSQCQM